MEYVILIQEIVFVNKDLEEKIAVLYIFSVKIIVPTMESAILQQEIVFVHKDLEEKIAVLYIFNV
jgi:hypothetical protein